MLAAASTILRYDFEKILGVVTAEERCLALDYDWTPTDCHWIQSAICRAGLFGHLGECPKCKLIMWVLGDINENWIVFD